MIRQLYPIVTTNKLAQCREFYERLLGGEVVFAGQWYLQVRLGQSEIGFIHPEAPSEVPLYRQPFVSKGLSLTLEVDDAAAEYQRLKSLGVETLGQASSSDRGEFHFRLLDPAGQVLNVLERKRPADADIIEI